MKMFFGALLGLVPSLPLGILLLFSEENPRDFQPSVYDLNLTWFLAIIISGVVITSVITFMRRRDNIGFFLSFASGLAFGIIYPAVVWVACVMGVMLVLLPLLLIWQIWQNLLVVMMIAGILLGIWAISQLEVDTK